MQPGIERRRAGRDRSKARLDARVHRRGHGVGRLGSPAGSSSEGNSGDATTARAAAPAVGGVGHGRCAGRAARTGGLGAPWRGAVPADRSAGPPSRSIRGDIPELAAAIGRGTSCQHRDQRERPGDHYRLILPADGFLERRSLRFTPASTSTCTSCRRSTRKLLDRGNREVSAHVTAERTTRGRHLHRSGGTERRALLRRHRAMSCRRSATAP